MCEDEANVGKAGEAAMEKEARDAARDVEHEFDRWRRNTRNEMGTAERRGRMDEDHGFAAVQLGKEWIEGRLARPFVAIARDQLNAFGIQRGIRIVDLFQRGIDVGHRHRRKKAEAPGMLGAEL